MKDMKEYISSLDLKGEEGGLGEEEMDELHPISSNYVAKTYTNMQCKKFRLNWLKEAYVYYKKKSWNDIKQKEDKCEYFS
jgi:hypothetical protein